MAAKQIIGGILGIILGIAVAVISPPEGLTVPAMWTLGIFVGGLVFMVFDVMPDYLVTLSMCILWPVFKTVPFDKSFSFFANANWWLMVGALGMGVAAQQCGLLKRISFLIMNLFPATFSGQTAGLLGAGMVIAPTIPSTSAKITIFAPLCASLSDAMGYKPKSKGAVGLFGAIWAGFYTNMPSFLSASYLCYIMLSTLPKDVQAQFTWMQWFLMALPWTVVYLVLHYLAIQLFYRPERSEAIPKGYAAEQLSQMGPMSRNEKITLVVLAMSLLLWMTEKLHGISSPIVAVAAMILLLYAKVFDRAEFRAKMPWDVLIFAGSIIGIAAVFPALKIDKWMASVLVPYISPLISNPYLFITALCVLIYVIRFVLLSTTAGIVIFTVMLAPIAAQGGMNPWIVGLIAVACVDVYHMYYQNAGYIIGHTATGGEVVGKNQLVKLAVAYMFISLIGFLISVPYWQMMGLIR